MWRRGRKSTSRDAAAVADEEGGDDAAHGESRFAPRPRPTATHPGSDPRDGVLEAGAQQLVGHRVVRMLGRGTRATVYLGHSRAITTGLGSTAGADPGHDSNCDDAEAAKPSVADPDNLVALKIFRPGTESSAIDLEVQVLTGVSSPHVISLADIASTPGDGMALVLPYLGGGTLRHLLERRLRLQPGEAVNLLVPIVHAVIALYECGFHHHNLNSSRVLFDSRGTPVLTGIGRVRPLRGRAGPAAPPDSTEDLEIWEALMALGAEVVAHVQGEESSANNLTLNVRVSPPDSHGTLPGAARELVAWLFEWADPLPVAADDPVEVDRSVRGQTTIPGRTHQGLIESAETDGVTDVEWGPRSWLGVFHLPADLRDIVEGALDRNPVHIVKDAWRAMPARARRILVTGGLVFAVLSTGLLLATPDHGRATDPERASRDSAVSGDQAAAVGHASSPAPSDSGGSEPMMSASEHSDIVGNDPLVAIDILLAVRERCVRERSVLCLTDVVQENTALMEGDRLRMNQKSVSPSAGNEGAGAVEPRLVGPLTHTSTLVERTGDAALVLWKPREADANQPVSVLMMRTEAGWLLREIFHY